MAPARIYVGEYQLGTSLGEGSFGIVREGMNISTGEKVAIKRILAANIEKVKLEQEIKNQQLLQHKHVVGFKDNLSKNGDAYIVMELMSGGDLFDFIKRNVRMPEKIARHIFQQIIAGVEHCHANKVAHRDLKPENIFLDDAQNIKIGDFGLSVRMEEGKLLTHSCGTWNYAAPEVLTKNCQYDGAEADIWSCGIILFELLCSELPFDAENKSDLFQLIRQGQFVVPGYVSTEAKDLIKKMLTVNGSERISLSDIKEHPWFTKDLPTDLFPRCVGAQYEELMQDVDESSLQNVVEARSTSIDHHQKKKPLETRSTSIGTETSRATSTVSSLFNHHHQKEKAYFDGDWVADGSKIASISGTSLVWADTGAVEILKHITGERFSINYQGSELMAELRDDGKLHWSDGDTWERQAS